MENINGAILFCAFLVWLSIIMLNRSKSQSNVWLIHTVIHIAYAAYFVNTLNALTEPKLIEQYTGFTVITLGVHFVVIFIQVFLNHWNKK